MGYTITAKPIDWIPSEQMWQENRFGFWITHDSDTGEYEAAWGEGDVGTFPSLEEAQQWCQNAADEWARDNVLVTHN